MGDISRRSLVQTTKHPISVQHEIRVHKKSSVEKSQKTNLREDTKKSFTFFIVEKE